MRFHTEEGNWELVGNHHQQHDGAMAVGNGGAEQNDQTVEAAVAEYGAAVARKLAVLSAAGREPAKELSVLKAA